MWPQKHLIIAFRPTARSITVPGVAYAEDGTVVAWAYNRTLQDFKWCFGVQFAPDTVIKALYDARYGAFNWAVEEYVGDWTKHDIMREWATKDLVAG